MSKISYFLKRGIIGMVFGFWLMGSVVGSDRKGDEKSEIVDTIRSNNFTLILKKDGTVWGWGKNEHGELGVGITSEQVASPVQTILGSLNHVVSIGYDGGVVTATRDDGSVWKSSDDQKHDANLFLNGAVPGELGVQEEKSINEGKSDRNLDLFWDNKMFQKMQDGVVSAEVAGKSSPLIVTTASLNQTEKGRFRSL